MSYLIHEGIKVKCEITKISSGRQKKMWQTRLDSQNIPNYLAQIVYIGGGRGVKTKNLLSSLNVIVLVNFFLGPRATTRRLPTRVSSTAMSTSCSGSTSERYSAVI